MTADELQGYQKYLKDPEQGKEDAGSSTVDREKSKSKDPGGKYYTVYCVLYG